MSSMQVLVRVGVTFDAAGYEEAGQVLDAIDRKIAKVLDGKGHHDITGFETRPCKAVEFDQAVNVAMAQPIEFQPAARYRA